MRAENLVYDTALTMFLSGQGGSLYLPLSLCDIARRLPALHHCHSLPPHPLLPLQQGTSSKNSALKYLAVYRVCFQICGQNSVILTTKSA